MNTSRFLLAMLMTSCLWILSCGAPPVTWQFTIKPDNGNTVISMEHITLVFQGIDLEESVGGHTEGASGSMMVAGSRRNMTTVTLGDIVFRSFYSYGVNTITFGPHTLILTDAGTSLRCVEQEFSLEGSRLRLVIAPDGSIQEFDLTPLSS